MKRRKICSALMAGALMLNLLCVPALAAGTDTKVSSDTAAATYVVQMGDTLSSITTNFYGTNEQRSALYNANSEAFKATGGRLVPGMVLVLPERLGSDSLIPPPVAGTGESLYLVKHGDTLGSIAKTIYGKADDYKMIYERNKDRLKSADMIYEGQVIVLPAKSTTVDTAPAEPAAPPAEPATPAGLNCIDFIADGWKL